MRAGASTQFFFFLRFASFTDLVKLYLNNDKSSGRMGKLFATSFDVKLRNERSNAEACGMAVEELE